MNDGRPLTTLPVSPADDTAERINLLYDLLVPGLTVVQVAALDELRDTALTLHVTCGAQRALRDAALRREDSSTNIGTGS